jgi:hypothetical protein
MLEGVVTVVGHDGGVCKQGASEATLSRKGRSEVDKWRLHTCRMTRKRKWRLSTLAMADLPIIYETATFCIRAVIGKWEYSGNNHGPRLAACNSLMAGLVGAGNKKTWGKDGGLLIASL